MPTTTALFFPRPLLQRPDLPDKAPHLYRLLCRGDCEALANPDPCAVLCALFALPPGAGPGAAGPGAGQDPPAAVLRLLAADQDPGTDSWICADPVRLTADLNGLFLYPLAQGTLDMGEAEALAARLAPVLEPRGMTLRVLSPQRWCLRIGEQEHAAVQTTSLAVAAGRDVRTLLPRGEARQFWHRLLTECQMALHDEQLDPPATAPNSLWFWGAGAAADSSANSSASDIGRPVAGEPAAQPATAPNSAAVLPDTGRTKRHANRESGPKTGEPSARLSSSSRLRVFADEPLCQALAKRAGVFCAPLPDALPCGPSGGVVAGGSAGVSPAAPSGSPAGGSPGAPSGALAGVAPGGPGEAVQLFVLDAVDPPAPQDSGKLAWLENAWFTPALKQLRAGHLRRLTILDNTHRLTIDRRALWRFWRRKPRWPK